jgi:RecB family exonuclease
VNFQKVPVDPDVLPLLRRREVWSPTTVDRFGQCPFAFFLRESLNIRSRRWGYFPANPPLTGTILHRIMARAILLRPDEDRSREVAEIVAREFDTPAGRLFLPRIGTEARNRYVAAVVRTLLDHPELGQPVQRAAGDIVTEHTLSHRLDSISLEGTADLIVPGEEGDAVYDYKSRLRQEHGSGKVLPEGAGDLRESSTLQLPLYALMYHGETGRQVDRLVYVDLTSAEVKVIADRRGDKRTARGWERLQGILDGLPDYVGRLEKMVSTGDLRCDEEPDCSACRVRSICRSCFVTRRYVGDS